MKRTLAVTAMCMFAVSPAALADKAHDPAAPTQGMHEHMKTMQEQMGRIRAATDPKEKERLVNEHLKAMEESMSRMHGMMNCGKM